MIPKFRAFDKKTSKIYGVGLLDYYHDAAWLDDVIEDECVTVATRKFSEVELMQSTGLFDKNGREIFEGDIVKRYRSPFFKAKWEYQIETVLKEKASLLLGREFGKNFGTIPFDSPFAKSDLLEVIGNVHENPELLEEKE